MRPLSGARLSPERRQYERGITVGDRERRVVPPSSREATPSPGGIEFRSVSGLILECLESPGRRRCPAAAPAPPSAGRGITGFAARRTPFQSAARGAAVPSSADTPGYRAQTFAASTRHTDRRRLPIRCVSTGDDVEATELFDVGILRSRAGRAHHRPFRCGSANAPS
jgi:hypothetical protein